jgi:hypothetical protein
MLTASSASPSRVDGRHEPKPKAAGAMMRLEDAERDVLRRLHSLQKPLPEPHRLTPPVKPP